MIVRLISAPQMLLLCSTIAICGHAFVLFFPPWRARIFSANGDAFSSAPARFSCRRARRGDAPTVQRELGRADPEDAGDCRSGLYQLVASATREGRPRLFSGL